MSGDDRDKKPCRDAFEPWCPPCNTRTCKGCAENTPLPEKGPLLVPMSVERQNDKAAPWLYRCRRCGYQEAHAALLEAP